MFKILLLLCFVFLPKLCDSAQAIMPPQKKPPEFADLDGCYIPSCGKFMIYNEVYYPRNECISYNCKPDNNTYIDGCGAVQADSGCRIEKGDLSLYYPNCCDKLVCDETDEK